MATIRRAMQRFLPASRSIVTPERADERKVILGEYYAALSSSGTYPTYRPRRWPVERAVAEAYEKIVWIYKAAEAIASAASRLPFELKQGEETLDDHPLYRVLNKKANPMETGRQFRKRLSCQILLSKKGAFVEITKSRGGDIVRVDLLPPGRTTPVPGKGQDLLSHYEVVRLDGSSYTIEPENVRWFRDPHPLDAYSGVTPLEAAGMSIELDFLARLTNVAFLKNDARPGGVLAVKDVMGEDEMDRIEARFAKGAPNAGTLTVINGQVTYTDLAAQPRDMQYETTSSIAKKEILTAFGVPESVIGDASGRTFDNAEQEEFNFWSITMPPHLDILTTGLDGDSEDSLEGCFNTDGIVVLQRTKIARRAEAREEFMAGLISAKEYRSIAGYEVIDTEHTRSLYIPSGKTEIPTSDADKKLMEEEANKKFEQQQRAAIQQATARNGNAASDGKENPSGGQPTPKGGEQQKLAEGATRGATAAREGKMSAFAGARRPSVRLIRPTEVKTAEPDRESALDAEARDRLESALESALAALMVRLTARAAARVTSPKARKHTRHWQAEFPDDSRMGTKGIDAEQAVDATRWEEETEQAAHPLVEAAAVAAAMALLADLGGPALTAAEISTLAAPIVSGVLRMLRVSAARQATRLASLIREADLANQAIGDMALMIRTYATKMAGWAKAVAVQAATAAVNGAREAAARAMQDQPTALPARETVGVGDSVRRSLQISRTWRHRGDSRVRETHRAAGGQLRPLGTPFRVGNALLRYPGDEEGPPQETHGCRCWLLYRSAVTGHFMSAPPGEITRNPFRAAGQAKVAAGAAATY